MNPGKKGVVAQVVYHYLLYSCAEIFNHIGQQVVRHWSRRLDTFQSAVDRKDFNYTNNDGKTAMTMTLFYNNYLLVGHFVNDYT